ncbi:MAG: RNA-binding S4 domain-containing protein [bacterium]
MTPDKSSNQLADRIRLDKWLWAARFFKTRALAKKAIEGGDVRVDGLRPKVSKEVVIGMEIIVRQGWDRKVIIVEGLSDQRRGAPEAAKLYAETKESIAAREREADARRLSGNPQTAGRPNKKQRRHIHRFKQLTLGED